VTREKCVDMMLNLDMMEYINTKIGMLN
jgi:hypothetical protein